MAVRRIGGSLRTRVTTIAAALVLGALPAAAPQAAAATPSSDHSGQTVTLITGDRVLVPESGGRPALLPTAGRRVEHHIYTTRDGHTHVVPRDAIPLLRTGQLDPRLFDVTALAKAGYDDRRADLPLIQTGPTPRLAGIRATRELHSIDGHALSVDKAALANTWQALTAAGGKVLLDGKRAFALDRSTGQIGAPAAWQTGLTGTGVKVAVVDSGVDETHPDLVGKEIAQADLSPDNDPVDRLGHGTHVASIIAGGGPGSKYRGVASGARLLDAKVGDRTGNVQDSWILAGMEWAVAQGADVVNLSIGGLDGEGIDPLEEAVNRLSAESGALFVVAAGNEGPRAGTISSPGSADAALTVGSVERDDTVSLFSSRGPRVGDGAIKPDISAPGSGIVAAAAAEGRIGDPVEPGYVRLSGTSMATPHVVGAAALVAQQHPDWNGEQLKAALTASATPTAGATVFDQGSGRVDVAKAITQTLTTTPTSVSFGRQRWPHDSDTAITRQLTYRNTGTAAVTLDLTVDAARAGVFTVSPARVVVPAGGTATASVTADTRRAPADGTYSGSVVATGGARPLRTPVGVDREPESYDLTLRHTFAADRLLSIVGLDTDVWITRIESTDVTRLRLPKGRYAISDVNFDAENRPTYFFGPSVPITGNSELVVDTRNSYPVSITPPDRSAPLDMAFTGYESRSASGAAASGTLSIIDLAALRVGQLGPDAPKGTFTWAAGAYYTNPTESYALTWFLGESVPKDFHRTVRKRDLATVHTSIATPFPDTTIVRRISAQPPGGAQYGGVYPWLHETGPEVTEHYNAGDLSWVADSILVVDPLYTSFTSEAFRVRPGETTRQYVNHGVFGPALPRNTVPWAERYRDDMFIGIGLWGDSFGNAGFSQTTSARSTLSRDGKVIGTSDQAGGRYEPFHLPPGPGRYTLDTTGTRDPRFQVSTTVAATWTFQSDPGQAKVPLSVVRFHAVLDESNSLPTGKFCIPVSVQLEDGRADRPRRLAVDVSYDEGRTWKPARLLGGFLLLLDHPSNAGSVSLRATAEDSRGNTVKQTITRAYLLKKH
ncbi:S8 family peptidase [Actinokineospora enzanensis]|uniref:S8 family peptidase n=1 Tax=Actinokineospora enzanensis TaxID=155975 RepID=UPI00146A9317|nr:S8 family serine peptidase [Actinokineospora enzanensis]